MTIDFVDLHLHSTYSNLDGFGSPKQIAQRAKSIGRKALSLTDHGSVSGFVQLMQACKEEDIKPIYGCEFYMVESIEEMFATKQREKYHLTVIAKNLAGYRNVLKLASLSYSKGFYYRPTIDKKMLFEHSEGIYVFSGCYSGYVQHFLKNGDKKSALRIAGEFKEALGSSYLLETQHLPIYKDTIDGLLYVSEQLELPMVLTCDPHYLTDDQASVQEILHAIRDRRTFDEDQIIHGLYQWPADDLLEAVQTLYPQVEWEGLFNKTVEIANDCTIDMPMGSVPKYPNSSGQTVEDLLRGLCKEGIKKRGLLNLPEDKRQMYVERLRKELRLIESKDYSDYFLIVADIVNWAKKEEILVGPARGSSAGSLVCYLTGITEVNPFDFNLVFERFIDESRYDLPDIDIDFEDTRREEVKDYLISRYGDDKVCNVATFAKFKGKNSLDEIGKVFRIPQSDIKTVKKYLVERSGADMRAALTIQDTFEMSPEAKEISEKHPDIAQASVLEGNLRHMSQHAAGVIVGAEPLQNIIALYMRNDKAISSVEMKDASVLGLVKIDILGIKELQILSKVCELIGQSPLSCYDISLTDPVTMKGFVDLDVEGIFQFEGDSTKSVLRQIPDLREFEQLVACVTLSKPGPAHSGGTTKYLARARGEDVDGFDWHPVLDDITKDTYYQIIYQEQVLRIVREIGNMAWTDANKIRNAMSKSQGENIFNSYWPNFSKGALENGLTEEQAIKVWEETKTMGRWAFNKSHAVSYAMLAWWSMYMKQHHQLEFYLARLLREGDEDKRRRLLYEINKRGIKIFSPEVGKSGAVWALEGDRGLRAGLTEIKGIGAKVAEKIVASGATSTEELKGDKKVKGFGAKGVEKLEDALAQTDFFDLTKFDILDERVPERQKLTNIRDHDKAYPITVAGVFHEMNYKDSHEEARSRGRDSSNMKNPDISKYAMLLLMDETDRCLVNVGRYLFDKIGQTVWDAYNNGDMVVVKGTKVSGWRIVRAKSVEILQHAKN
jgi:DNA polymerase-3 subunit alpha